MFRDLGDAKRILRELKLLRHFRPHENVVTILDIMVYPENSLDFRCTPLLNKAEYHVLVGREGGRTGRRRFLLLIREVFTFMY